jgi:hypothetical protein
MIQSRMFVLPPIFLLETSPPRQLRRRQLRSLIVESVVDEVHPSDTPWVLQELLAPESRSLLAMTAMGAAM